MGEGHYCLIGVGCLSPRAYFGPHDDTSEKMDTFVGVMEAKGVHLQPAYESEPAYLCVLVALDNPNASSAWNRPMPLFSTAAIPDLLRAAEPANPDLDVPGLLAEFEQRPVLSRQIAELSKRSMTHWRNREFAEHDRLEAEIYHLQLKTCEWRSFACLLPSLPDSGTVQIPAETLARARDAWSLACQVASTNFGVVLPHGGLVFADDWD